ncbi:MAG: hypothetical protein ACKV2T_07750 [Kofleriaceae bacterium]
MSIRTDVLLWAQRVVARGANTPAHVLLDVKSDASIEVAQDAFHKIARTSHPDLHRASLNAEELELVTTAYSRVAAAYHELRSRSAQTARPLKDDPPPPRSSSSDKFPAMRPQEKPPEGTPPVARSGTTPNKMKPIQRTPTMQGTGVGGSSQSVPGAPGPMNSRGLIYYRKAELCLRQGDLKTAVLNMKMAIAGDPQSTFLRTALAEIEAELSKK